MTTDDLIRDPVVTGNKIGELGSPLITVIYPLFDIRGSAANALMTWSQKQTLPRDRYRVFVLSSEEGTSREHALHHFLNDSDRIIEVPKGNDVAMWNAGAAQATTPWLVFVEAHSLAEPKCLEEVAAWIVAGGDLVGNFSVLHSDAFRLARLADKWFTQIQSTWRDPGTWRRVHRSGFVVRADVFRSTGGLSDEYGQFAPALLSARLHAMEVQIKDIPNAAVVHLDDQATSDHHYDTADFAAGEIACRSHQERSFFFERYFGYSDLWSNRIYRSRRMQWHVVRALVAAAVAYPREMPALVSIALQTLSKVPPGTSAWSLLRRALIKLDEFAIDHLPLPPKLLWARFLSAHQRVVLQTQYDWVRDYRASSDLQKAPAHLPIETLASSDLGGVHGLEQFNARNFRWTWPLFVLRVASVDSDLQIRIDTGGLRGNPLDCVIAVVINGSVLPRSALSAEGGVLTIALPSTLASSASDGIFVICNALVPGQTGSPDPRKLGLPVFAVALSSKALN